MQLVKERKERKDEVNFCECSHGAKTSSTRLLWVPVDLIIKRFLTLAE